MTDTQFSAFQKQQPAMLLDKGDAYLQGNHQSGGAESTRSLLHLARMKSDSSEVSSLLAGL